MKNRRITHNLTLAALIIATVPGCQALHVYRPVVIEAVDAETKKPLPGAEVHLSYPLSSSSSAPWDAIGTTGGDGNVKLKAAPYGEAGILVDVAVPGYMSERKSYSIESVRAIEPVGFFESGDKRPVNYVVELYAEPFPGVELVLPNGYRGVVKAAVRVRDDLAAPPGQRLFSYVVPPSGEVEVVGPSLLRRVYSSDFHARFADGTVLNRDVQGEDVGFWCLKSEGGTEYFVVGTRADFETLRRADRREGSGGKRSSGGNGGGGGHGRHGRGGNSSADPSAAGS